jgi:hypothetical protein
MASADSYPNTSARPDLEEIFMPPGDMDAARRLAVVFTDPPSGFSAPAGGIGLALCRALPELQIELVPSGVGAMYARFRSHHERELAIEHGDIFYDDVRIFLGREETAARAPRRNYKCALIWASPFPAEHVNPLGIRMAFAKVGQLLEIDPLCLVGADMAAVRAVVALEDPAMVPNDLWPKLTGVDIRVPEVVVVRVWPYADSFVDGVYQRFFAPPPPPPFRHNRPHLPGYPVGYRHATAAPLQQSGSGSEDESRFSERRHGGVRRMLTCLAPRVLFLNAPPPSPAASTSTSPASVATSMFSSTDGSREIVAAALPTPAAERHLPPAVVEAAAEDDEERWESVAGSARNRRKAKARAKRDLAKQVAERKKSVRLAANEPPLYVDAVTKATKRRELRDALKGCSAKLQAHVAKSKILRAISSPLGVKSVSELADAALGSASMVPDGSDD